MVGKELASPNGLITSPRIFRNCWLWSARWIRCLGEVKIATRVVMFVKAPVLDIVEVGLAWQKHKRGLAAPPIRYDVRPVTAGCRSIGEFQYVLSSWSRLRSVNIAEVEVEEVRRAQVESTKYYGTTTRVIGSLHFLKSPLYHAICLAHPRSFRAMFLSFRNSILASLAPIYVISISRTLR